MECPKIYGYSIESVLAEKFEAIVSLGYANSRFKDFYDIYVILQSEKIDDTLLQEAIVQTFRNRNTTFDDIVVFEDSFATEIERVNRWNAFVKKKNALVQVTFDKVVEQIKTYFKPIVEKVG
jgi:predicted nucleotidyltransferase component of viral defense system